MRYCFVVLTLLTSCGGSGAQVEPPPPATEDASLGAGDVFDIRVYGETDLSATYRVSSDGTIDFPFIGRTSVAGLEPPVIADLIAERLKEGGYFHAPQVSILVLEYNSKRVNVIGAVARPGSLPLTPGMTVLQAITVAGGFTALAAQNDTVVTRTVGGERRRYNVRVGDVSSGEAPDLPLRPDDIIYVPERIF